MYIAETLAPWHGKIRAALSRAERAKFTRPAPKSPRAQMKFLRTRANGSTKALAGWLGVSRSTVQRRLFGVSTKPQKPVARPPRSSSRTNSSASRSTETRSGCCGGLFWAGRLGASRAVRLRATFTQ